uniref:Uncharacterized protein n=1 Tax=Chromera velia CCMP2878 TaxID=1169474 RepID=A0A0G4I8T6_9ALVE|eukprot:Cvel_12044.t1-p1 / transcript=Cvel_12044.t1 / gene=Cvel_12044 / organism=Chromera_velia_CCMP2878 / gene_product=hypothetical protein / transcript_product=hypothetical protein / location=Cvel_scaffold774:277-7735(+) / protein_length=1348 / sequence_SO=supercontig / SO=protein_coding / is_pseudo=false
MATATQSGVPAGMPGSSPGSARLQQHPTGAVATPRQENRNAYQLYWLTFTAFTDGLDGRMRLSGFLKLIKRLGLRLPQERVKEVKLESLKEGEAAQMTKTVFTEGARIFERHRRLAEIDGGGGLSSTATLQGAGLGVVGGSNVFRGNVKPLGVGVNVMASALREVARLCGVETEEQLLYLIREQLAFSADVRQRVLGTKAQNEMGAHDVVGSPGTRGQRAPAGSSATWRSVPSSSLGVSHLGIAPTSERGGAGLTSQFSLAGKSQQQGLASSTCSLPKLPSKGKGKPGEGGGGGAFASATSFGRGDASAPQSARGPASTTPGLPSATAVTVTPFGERTIGSARRADGATASGLRKGLASRHAPPQPGSASSGSPPPSGETDWEKLRRELQAASAPSAVQKEPVNPKASLQNYPYPFTFTPRDPLGRFSPPPGAKPQQGFFSTHATGRDLHGGKEKLPGPGSMPQSVEDVVRGRGGLHRDRLQRLLVDDATVVAALPRSLFQELCRVAVEQVHTLEEEAEADAAREDKAMTGLVKYGELERDLQEALRSFQKGTPVKASQLYSRPAPGAPRTEGDRFTAAGDSEGLSRPQSATVGQRSSVSFAMNNTVARVRRDDMTSPENSDDDDYTDSDSDESDLSDFTGTSSSGSDGSYSDSSSQEGGEKAEGEDGETEGGEGAFKRSSTRRMSTASKASAKGGARFRLGEGLRQSTRFMARSGLNRSHSAPAVLCTWRPQRSPSSRRVTEGDEGEGGDASILFNGALSAKSAVLPSSRRSNASATSQDAAAAAEGQDPGESQGPAQSGAAPTSPYMSVTGSRAVSPSNGERRPRSILKKQPTSNWSQRSALDGAAGDLNADDSDEEGGGDPVKSSRTSIARSATRKLSRQYSDTEVAAVEHESKQIRRFFDIQREMRSSHLQSGQQPTDSNRRASALSLKLDEEGGKGGEGADDKGEGKTGAEASEGVDGAETQQKGAEGTGANNTGDADAEGDGEVWTEEALEAVFRYHAHDKSGVLKLGGWTRISKKAAFLTPLLCDRRDLEQIFSLHASRAYDGMTFQRFKLALADISSRLQAKFPTVDSVKAAVCRLYCTERKTVVDPQTHDLLETRKLQREKEEEERKEEAEQRKKEKEIQEARKGTVVTKEELPENFKERDHQVIRARDVQVKVKYSLKGNIVRPPTGDQPFGKTGKKEDLFFDTADPMKAVKDEKKRRKSKRRQTEVERQLAEKNKRFEVREKTTHTIEQELARAQEKLTGTVGGPASATSTAKRITLPAHMATGVRDSPAGSPRDPAKQSPSGLSPRESTARQSLRRHMRVVFDSVVKSRAVLANLDTTPQAGVGGSKKPQLSATTR